MDSPHGIGEFFRAHVFQQISRRLRLRVRGEVSRRANVVTITTRSSGFSPFQFGREVKAGHVRHFNVGR